MSMKPFTRYFSQAEIKVLKWFLFSSLFENKFKFWQRPFECRAKIGEKERVSNYKRTNIKRHLKKCVDRNR